MKNVKRFSILAAVLVLALGILTACGGGSDSGSGDGDSADKTIKVAASPTPHAEILNNVYHVHAPAPISKEDRSVNALISMRKEAARAEKAEKAAKAAARSKKKR